MMFMVLSYVIEVISGISLGDFMHSRIWGPLSMNHTYFSPRDALHYENKSLLAHGYFWDDKTCDYSTELWMDDPIVSGAGNVISSVVDYSKYLRAMLQRAPPMSAQWYHEMRVPRSVVAVEAPLVVGPAMYTLGWEYLNYRGEEIYEHGGAVTVRSEPLNHQPY